MPECSGGSGSPLLQTPAATATICLMPRRAKASRQTPEGSVSSSTPFQSGVMVIVTLGNPRDKFWGAILALRPEGLSLAGIELASFDDLVAMVRDKEPFSASVVFFPMHRVERMELDLSDDSLPSLSHRFAAKTGQDPATLFTRHLTAGNEGML